MLNVSEILTPTQRLAVALKGDGHTRAEIARQRGVTPQAIKKLWSRSRKRLLAHMTPEERECYTAHDLETRVIRATSLFDEPSLFDDEPSI